MELFLEVMRSTFSGFYPLLLVYMMTNFKCERKTAAFAFMAAILLGVCLNLAILFAFGRLTMMRLFAVMTALPCAVLLWTLSSDRISHHLFNFFTAINALYFSSAIGGYSEQMRNAIWPDIAVRTLLGVLLLILFQRYWLKPYRFLSSTIKKGWGVISVVPLLFFLLVMFIGLYPGIQNNRLIVVVFLYILLFFVYLVIYRVFHSTYDLLMREQESSILTVQLENQRRYYEHQLGSAEEIRRLRHDLQGQLSTAAALLSDQKPAEALDYLTRVAGYQAVPPPVRFCDNAVLNAAISVYAAQLQECGARFESSICLAGVELPEIELCLMLTNALQNALEAVSGLPEADRLVRLQAALNQGQLLLRISNGFRGRLRFEDGFPRTTKPAAGHGYGLSTIRSAAERLGGDVSVSVRDELFMLNIRVPLRQAAPAAANPS